MTATLPVEIGIFDPTGAAIPVFADPMASPFTQMPIKVRLTKDFYQLCPEGWPTAPGQLGANPMTWYPHVFPNGSEMVQFACVANAMVAAGGAVLA